MPEPVVTPAPVVIGHVGQSDGHVVHVSLGASQMPLPQTGPPLVVVVVPVGPAPPWLDPVV